ncbi:MAG TPA: alanine--tRNA ligase [Ignavibacteriaceae bacterium]|nr:alanine--tRNA ligase [Ignavibacteriaceae bacterium]
MTSSEIRQQFLDFFKSKNHRIVPSSPVVPYDDPTLLFTNAGMNQFKDVFLNTGKREYLRAADTQKCIRVSGKHNDLEEVGHDTYHHTFFEMLGNWSFGDYYKKEAIAWAWELLTEVWKLPKERLWATVYKDDDEALKFWETQTDINPKHILKFAEKDNFWEMGETGPCGPCSEIHINVGDDFDNPKYVNAGVPECIEIWNLVFIQYNRDETGKLNDLPAKHVDTGMGFERVCAVLQNKKSNYETDVFTPLIKKIEEISTVKYKLKDHQIAMRVIADHVRALTFAIADGAVPGNEGRGYVLRRILRRAARYGRKLNLNEPFLFRLTEVISETMGGVFPEVTEKKEYVQKVIKAEEESFNATLDRGIELFDEVIIKLNHKKLKTIPGEEVFKLYDTFGFPVDLTNVMAQEKGFTIDEDGFNKLMDQQKERARDASKDKFSSVNISANDLSGFNLLNNSATEFTGYIELKSSAIVIGTKTEHNNEFIILNKSPFYVESGGQIDDVGKLISESNSFNVVDVFKTDNRIIHVIENDSKNVLKPGTELIAEVDSNRRWDIMRNHSATHFLHKALRTIIGTHVQQAGSYVGPDRLRFDFSHFSKLSAEELQDIEALVNEQLRRNLQLIHHRDTPFEQAKKMGALMFFGDKYGDKVNVVQFGDFTMEFCGGTHVHNSSEIGLFKIISEASVASGVRRIEAVTGAGVEKYIHSQLEQLRTSEQKIEELFDVKKKLEKEIAELRMKEKLGQLDHILSLSSEEKGIKIFKGKVHADSMEELKSFGDEMRSKMGSGVGVLIAQIDDKAGIVAVVSDDLIKQKNLSAGKIVGELAKLVGGGGGGRSHLATAGGKDVQHIVMALTKVEKIVSKFL